MKKLNYTKSGKLAAKRAKLRREAKIRNAAYAALSGCEKQARNPHKVFKHGETVLKP